MHESRPWVGITAALAVVGLWSGFLLISRYGLRAEIAPADMAALRFGVSGLVMAPVLLIHGLSGLSWWRAAFLALTGGLGFALLIYRGFGLAPAAYAAVLLPGVLPLFTILLAWCVLGERVRPALALPLALIIAGVAILGAATIDGGEEGRFVGALFFLSGSFSWACFTVALRRWRVAPLQATAIVSVFAAVAYLPVYLLVLPQGLADLGWTTLVVQGFYQGIAAVVLALLAFTVAVRHLGPATTTMITSATPAVVAIAAIWLLAEPLSAATAAGVAAVVAGGILTARTATRKARA